MVSPVVQVKIHVATGHHLRYEKSADRDIRTLFCSQIYFPIHSNASIRRCLYVKYQIPFESHNIPCADGVSIHAWLLLRDKNRSSQLPTILFFHGNAGNIGLRLPNAMEMMQYLNVNILMVEYRGYGDSDSVRPNEAGLKLDAEAALRFILKHPDIDAASIFLFGRSLGGAVAFHLAQYAEEQKLPLAGVMVENTFTNIADMVDQLMPYISPLKALVLRIRWDNLSIVKSLKVPVLYLAGARDELVPHSHMHLLHKLTTLSRLNKIHVIKDGTHNESWIHGGQQYWEAMRNFMSEAARRTALSLSGRDIVENNVSSPIRPMGDIGGNASSIPIMPKNILNIAQEAMRTTSTSSTTETPNKKEL